MALNSSKEYVSAADKGLGDRLLGATIHVNQSKIAEFKEAHPDFAFPLSAVFTVTNISGEKCSIYYRDAVCQVEPKYFLTKNPEYRLY